ncbi:MAG TPA: AraC family transcriptional regulator, partial [Bacilli bacterium]
ETVNKIKSDCLSMSCPPFPAFISCGETVFKPGDVHMDRIFPVFVIMYVTKGIVYLTEGNRQYELTAGEWFIQTPGVRHFGHRASGATAKYYWIHFMPISEWSVLSPNQSSGQSLNANVDFQVMDIGQGIRIPEFHLKVPMHALFIIEKWTTLLNGLLHSYSSVQDPIQSQSIFTELISLTYDRPNDFHLHKKADLADRVAIFLRANFMKKITIKSLACEFHYSPDYITKCFKQRYRCGTHEFISRLKMDYARDMLANTNKSIGDIGNELEYSDLTVFSRMFKGVQGVSPLGYRRTYGKIVVE